MAPPFDAPSFAARLKQLRCARGMSLQEVADAADLTKSHIWEMEQGRAVNPTVAAVWGLARALSVPPAVLLGVSTDVAPLHPVALRIAGLVDRELRLATPSPVSSNDGGEAPAREDDGAEGR